MVNRFLATPEAVAQAVREARAERGLSQAEVARAAGVGRRFVVELEAGHPRAELAKVLAVLQAVGVHAMALPAPPAPGPLEEVDLTAAVARFA